MKSYANAINSIKVFGDISFANTGAGCPEPLIASISDFMLDLAESTFFCCLFLQKEGVKLSVRAIKLYMTPARLPKRPGRFWQSGGHPAMAGGFIPYTRDDKMDAMIPAILEMRFKSHFRAGFCKAQNRTLPFEVTPKGKVLFYVLTYSSALIFVTYSSKALISAVTSTGFI